jgi:predicted RNase H-like nuclease
MFLKRFLNKYEETDAEKTANGTGLLYSLLRHEKQPDLSKKKPGQMQLNVFGSNILSVLGFSGLIMRMLKNKHKQSTRTKQICLVEFVKIF